MNSDIRSIIEEAVSTKDVYEIVYTNKSMTTGIYHIYDASYSQEFGRSCIYAKCIEIEAEKRLNFACSRIQSIIKYWTNIINKDRYCKTKGITSIPTKRHDVAINKYKREGDKKLLEGVPMGNLLYAYKAAMGKESPSVYNWSVECPDKMVELSEELITFWESFAEIRNEAAHSGNVEDTKYKDAKDSFASFQKDLILSLFKIKKSLRPYYESINHNKARRK